MANREVIFQAAWIIIFTYVSVAENNLSFTIKPSFLSLGDKFTVSCSGVATTERYFYEFKFPNQDTYCTGDCFFKENEYCWDNSEIGSCYCNDNVTTNAICKHGTNNVTFEVLKVNEKHFGAWICRFENTQTILPLERYVESSDPVLSGGPEVIENQETVFICVSTGGSPPARFQWYLNIVSSESNLTEDATPGTDKSTLKFPPNRNHIAIICRTLQLDSKPERDQNVTLSVLYIPVVALKINNHDHVTTYDVIEGGPLKLVCQWIEGNPEDNIYFTFFKGSESLQNTTDNTYNTITNIQRGEQGQYNCSAYNKAGQGQQSTTTVNVLYPPVIADIPSEITEVEGHDISITCTADANPNATIMWKKGGDVVDSQDGVLTLVNINRNQAGEYVCVAENVMEQTGLGPELGSDSKTVKIIVHYTPTGSPSVEIDDTTIAVEVEHIFTCDISQIDPGLPVADWSLWWRNGTFLQNVTSGLVWNYTSNTVKDSGNIQCEAANTIGTSSISLVKTVIYEAPATIENVMNNTGNPIYDNQTSGEFILSCTVSASNLHSIKWRKTGQGLTDDYYNTTETHINCKGQCSYGLDFATASEASWNLKDKQFTCDNVDYYDGEYKCVARATTAGDTTTITSEPIVISTHYAAMWNSDITSVVAEFEQKNVTLNCTVCARPEPTGYKWYYNELEVATGQHYTIASVTNFGIYYCEVHNDVGVKSFPLELLESGPAGDPLGFSALQNTTSSSMTLTWFLGRDGNHPPIEHQISVTDISWSDCANNTKFIPVDSRVEEDTAPENTSITHILEGLEPNTVYDVRLQAVNTKETNPESDNQYICAVSTKTIPSFNEDQWEINVEGNRIIIKWEYLGYGVFAQSDNDVGLKFNYSSDGELSPVNGTVNATDGYYEIPEEVDDKLPHKVIALAYEGYNTVARPVHQATTSPPTTSGFPPGGIVGIMLIFIIAILLVAGFVAHRKGMLPEIPIISGKKSSDDDSSCESIDELGADNKGQTTDDSSAGAYADVTQTGAYADVSHAGAYAEVVKKEKKENKKPPKSSKPVKEVKPQPQIENEENMSNEGKVRDLYAEAVKTDFKVGLEDQSVDEGADVTFTCRLTRPNKDITWSFEKGKKTEAIEQDDGKYLISYTKTGSKLEILKCIPQDAGKYTATCGPVSTTAKLSVAGKGKPTLPVKPTKAPKPVPGPSRQVNPDALVYADLEFGERPEGSADDVIHGIEDQTTYADIDFMPPFEESNMIGYHDYEDDIVGLLASDLDTDSDSVSSVEGDN